MASLLTPRCPHCNAVHTRAAGVSGKAAPENGDLGLCANCSQWMVFDSTTPTLTRKPNDEEHAFTESDADCVRARSILRILKGK